MTGKELSQIVYTMKAAYPRHFEKMSDQEMQGMLSAWKFILGEYDQNEIALGLKVYMTTDKSGFPPSPGQILQAAQKVKHPEDELTAAEAWAMTYKAIQGLNWECPEEAFNKLPRSCQRTIGTPQALAEIAAMDTESVLIGEKARFIRQYDHVRQQEADYMALPGSVRQAIEAAKQPQLAAEGSE